MFAIYDTQGLRYRDTLENLRALRTPRSQHTADRNPNAPKQKTSKDDDGLNEKAINAYRSVLKVKAGEPIVHAHQIMTSPVQTLCPNTTIEEAWHTLRSNDVRQVPVTTADLQPVGMLSMEDLLKAVVIEREKLTYAHRGSINKLMSTEVWAAEPITDVRRIAQVLGEYRLNAVPIVDARGVVSGIVSRTDMLRALATNPPLSLWT